jgi:hypothetical protein
VLRQRNRKIKAAPGWLRSNVNSIVGGHREEEKIKANDVHYWTYDYAPVDYYVCEVYRVIRAAMLTESLDVKMLHLLYKLPSGYPTMLRVEARASLGEPVRQATIQSNFGSRQ